MDNQFPFEIVGSFGSLEDLYAVMEGPTAPRLEFGGSVRLHPTLLPEQDMAAFIRTRLRLEELGLRLILTPAVGWAKVELRRHTRQPIRTPITGRILHPRPNV